MAKDDRQAALDKAMGDLEKRYGEGTIMKLGEAQHLVVDVIPTGSLSLDLALGVGGIPRGRVAEIFGPESSGKTTICQHIVAEAQELGGTAAFVDMEHALDPKYAEACGVDVDNLLVSQPDTGEQALEIVESLVRSGAVDVVVVDSVAALVPRAEIEGDMGDAHMGLMARLMSQALRKLSGAIKQTNTSVIFTNYARRSASCLATLKPPLVVRRSSSMPRCAWMCAAFSRSRLVQKLLVTAPACAWSRTKLPHLSRPSNSISCTTKVSPRLVILLIWALSLRSFRSVVRITPMAMCVWPKDAKTPRNT